MRRPRVVVFDYGSGNVRSAQQALERVGADVTVTADAMTARHADGLMVPGVGAFAECMRGLVAAGGAEVIEYRVTAERPILGVCVGAQVLFTSSAEHDTATKGLGVFDGAVTRLDATRVPHMGWNTVAGAAMPLFDGIPGDERFYFVHSYAARPPVADTEIALGDHGGPFIAAAVRGCVTVTQFHPEKSGRVGLTLLSNWLRSM